MKWGERTFEMSQPAGIFPCLLERLRGLPSRLEEVTASLPREICIRKSGDAWSIQEHAGHFLDTEELWQNRLDDYLVGREILTEADLTHSKTRRANHNANSLDAILSSFRRERLTLVERLERLSVDQLNKTSLHPRLKKPIRLVDSIYFTCEHDDHYFALLRVLLREITATPL